MAERRTYLLPLLALVIALASSPVVAQTPAPAIPQAAQVTTHILAKPELFVLQTGLNDFYVTYEINAYTDQPHHMATIYSELHRNIQDKFNEAGVEIMSPHFAQIRDGNKTAIPDQYLPKDYQATGLWITPLSKWIGLPTEDVSSRGDARP